MGYLHINNLYKDTTILNFKECYALEKVHGTSAHVGVKDGDLHIFSGGESHERFANLFDKDALKASLLAVCSDAPIILFGEAYGGKQQGMSATYGPNLCFVVFDVKIGDTWLSVPNAEDVAGKVGLEFIPYKKIPTDLSAIDGERDADSVVAMLRGMGPGKLREGVVLRPLEEMNKSNGARIIAKHKRDEFMETATPRKVDPGKLQMQADALKIAEEWVTINRLKNILSKQQDDFLEIENTGKFIALMTEDILREGAGEVIDSKELRKKISTVAALLFKRHICDVKLTNC